MSSGERNKIDNTDNPSKYNDNASMVGSSKRKMAPQIIISTVASKTQDGNLTDSGANIFTIGLH